MKQRTKNLLMVAGVICAVTGMMVSVPFILQSLYVAGFTAVGVMVIGLVLLAIAFGE